MAQARHLRDAHRHVQSLRGRARHLPGRHRTAGAPRAARGERGADHAGHGVRRRRLLGLQPGAHLRRREHLRRPGGPRGLRRRRACRRHRGHPRRRLQSLRTVRSRPLAVRRLERERQGRHLLLQRLAQRDALGRHPPRLRPGRGAPVHRRQRALLARRVPARRPALRHDALHPQRPRQRGRRRRRAARGLESHAGGQRRDRRPLSRPHHHRRGPPQQRRDHRRDRAGRRRLRRAVGRRVRPPHPRGADRARRRAAPHGHRRPCARSPLQRRPVPARRLYRVPRRGGQRQGAHPPRDRPGRSRRTSPRRSDRRSARR